MINKISNLLSRFDLRYFVIVNNNFEILSQSPSFTFNISNIISKIKKLSLTCHRTTHFECIGGYHILIITILVPTKMIIILFFPSYQVYLDNMQKIVSELYCLIALLGKAPDRKETLINSESKKIDYQDQKRQLELYFSHAIRNCDYKRIDILTIKLWDYSFCSSDIQKNSMFLINSIISLIGILTRIIINEGVDTRLAYQLSDHYMAKDYSSLTNLSYEFVKDIIYDFTLLLENSLYKFNVPIIDNAISFIRKNIYSVVYVSEIAKAIGISAEYLSSIFKEVTGINVKYFLQTEKLNEAKFLLISTDMAISTIAYKLGYSSQSHFSRIFKEYFKASPSSFRKGGGYID